MPVQITYNTSGGATAGTDIVFTLQAEEVNKDWISSRSQNQSDDGTWETVHRFNERRWQVMHYATNTEKDSYNTFFTSWASQGKAFLFWPTAAETSTYYTVKLVENDYRPRRIARKVSDRFKWTHNYRVTV
jgi:hypothetical protein